MFIGHFAAGLAAKRIAPQASLGVLVGAAQFPDLLWPILLLAGVERVEVDPGNTAFTPLNFLHYPYSHSLATTLLWAVAAGLLYWLVTRYRNGALVVGAMVVSHWALDLISHRPDLQLYPGSTVTLGLGLWNHVLATVLLEGSLFAVAVWLYTAGTVPCTRTGTNALRAYVVFLVLIYAANVMGPPPPDWRPVAMTGLATFLLVAWAAWFDARRSVRSIPARP